MSRINTAVTTTHHLRLCAMLTIPGSDCDCEPIETPEVPPS